MEWIWNRELESSIMAHYAILDENNVVINVIVGKDEDDPQYDWEKEYGAKRTSINTRGGVHYEPHSNIASADQSKAFRKNYAHIGFTYDPVRDAFIPPKPYPSWILNEDTCMWDAPVPYPEEKNGQPYFWDEETLSWVL